MANNQYYQNYGQQPQQYSQSQGGYPNQGQNQYGYQGQQQPQQNPQVPQQQGQRTTPFPHINFLYRGGKDAPMNEWIMCVEGYARSISIRNVEMSNGSHLVVDLQLSSIMTDSRIKYLFGEKYLSEYHSVIFRISIWDRNAEFFLNKKVQKNQKVIALVRNMNEHEYTGQNGVVYRSIQCTAVECPVTNSRLIEDRDMLVPEDKRNGGNNNQFGGNSSFGSYGSQSQGYGQPQPSQQGGYVNQGQPQQNPQAPQQQGGQPTPAPQGGNGYDQQNQGSVLGGSFTELADDENPFSDDEELPF